MIYFYYEIKQLQLQPNIYREKVKYFNECVNINFNKKYINFEWNLKNGECCYLNVKIEFDQGLFL